MSTPNMVKAFVLAIRENVRTQTAVRMSILASGLGLQSLMGNTHSFFRTAEIVESTVDPLETPKADDFAVFYLIEDHPCPIHALAINDWLVDAVQKWTDTPNFPFHTIDPANWTNNVVACFEAMPVEYQTEEARTLIDAIASDMEDPEYKERVTKLRRAMDRKGAAIEAGYTAQNCGGSHSVDVSPTKSQLN